MSTTALTEQTPRSVAQDSGFYLDRLECLTKICEATSWTTNYEDLYQRTALALAVNLDCDYANIYLLDVGGDNMTAYASHSQLAGYDSSDKTEVTSKPTLLGRLQRMIHNKEPIMMLDYTNPHPCDQIPPAAIELGFKSAITVPLLNGEEVLGIYNLVYKEFKTWSDDEVRFLKAIGRILGTNIHRAQMSRKVVEMQILNERKFLSSEIHDNLAQSVSTLKIGAESALLLLDKGDIDELRDALERQESIALQATKLLREEMLALRIPQSETEGLVPSIKETLKSFEQRWAIKTELIIDERSEPGLTIQSELQAMRILHECLSNVLKHAQANRVEVHLQQIERRLHMQITDNGKGFDPDAVSSERLGIRIMQERAESVNAKLSIESEIGKGTTVKLDAPSI